MIIDVTGKLKINYRASERINGKKAWCELPYPGHKKGKLMCIGKIHNTNKTFGIIMFVLFIASIFVFTMAVRDCDSEIKSKGLKGILIETWEGSEGEKQ